MNETKNLDDILIDIPDEVLETLAEKYRKQSKIPYASSLLRNGKKLREKGCKFISFMAPESSWKDDGTFFASMQFPRRYQVAIFTLDENGEKLYDILMKTKRIDYKNKVVFYAIHSNIYSTVLRVIEEKCLKTTKLNTNIIYTVPNAVAKNFHLRCSSEIKVAKLQIHHAATVNSHWTNNFDGSEDYVKAFIEHNGGLGIFLESSENPVAWVMKTAVGKIGLLHTMENHRGKGYASILVKALSKKIAEDGDDPTTNVHVANTTSQKLMEKLGFENLGLCYYNTLAEEVESSWK